MKEMYKNILIQGWMITKLKLEGKKLLLFALIYGFTQVEDTWFTGSTKYCAQWCDCSDKYILKLLKIQILFSLSHSIFSHLRNLQAGRFGVETQESNSL